MIAMCTTWTIALGGGTALDTLASSLFSSSTASPSDVGVVLQRCFIILFVPSCPDAVSLREMELTPRRLTGSFSIYPLPSSGATSSPFCSLCDRQPSWPPMSKHSSECCVSVHRVSGDHCRTCGPQALNLTPNQSTMQVILRLNPSRSTFRFKVSGSTSYNILLCSTDQFQSTRRNHARVHPRPPRDFPPECGSQLVLRLPLRSSRSACSDVYHLLDFLLAPLRILQVCWRESMLGRMGSKMLA